jgi:hypothetical protein
VREVIEPAGTTIALSSGEHQCEVTGASGLVKAIREPDEQLLGDAQPDEAPNRQRVTIEDQLGRRFGCDDLGAPPTHHQPMLSPSPLARRSEIRRDVGLLARDLGVMRVVVALVDLLNTRAHFLSLLRQHQYCVAKPITAYFQQLECGRVLLDGGVGCS